jgi:adhesin isopeptide-forming family sspB-C2 type protein
MGFRLFDHKRAKLATAVLAALATLLAPAASAVAADGGGDGSAGGGGVGDGSVTVKWAAKDSWPATYQGVVQAMGDMGWRVSDDQPATDAINTALTQALNECRTSWTGTGDPGCRLVTVGAAFSDQYGAYTGLSNWSADKWVEAWNVSGINNQTFTYNGVNWNAGTTWTDKLGTHSVGTMAHDNVMANEGASVRVIVLAKNQPVPDNYDLSVSTRQQAPAGVNAGSSDAVSDSIVTNRNGSSVAENVNADVWLNYDGHPAGLVASKAVKKSVSLPNQGTSASPAFTPKDFGWNTWPEGNYWFDITVSKQGRMKAAVDTADRQASESFNVPAVPPEPPVKKIEEGVSADSMTNRTTISTGTGLGGYAMTFKDTIQPNGMTYEVSNYKLVDTTDNNRDVSGEFAINWDKANNLVTATRGKDKGFLPLAHTYEFSFDVTMSQPETSKVTDVASVSWNDRPEVQTDSKEFPTWKPNPDKSWIKQGADGSWQAVVDPDETNATGADDNVFLDGDKVASVVNGTVDPHLIEAPKKFVLTDDFTAADYLVDPDAAKDIRVYEADATADADGHYRASSITDFANKGRDVTDGFNVTLKGSVATATAKADYLKKLRQMGAPLQVTLLVPMTVNFANGKGAAQVRKDHGVAAGAELQFCDADGVKFTNSGSEQVNDQKVPTNEPRICGYVPPVSKDVISEASEGGEQESVDGKVVYPGQKVEYQLLTTPQLPSSLAYGVKNVVFTDTYDQYLVPDKQTVELMDLGTGKVIGKAHYTTKWDESKHLFQLTINDPDVLALWKAGSNPRVQIRFEGTVSKDAPTDRKVNNQWMLTLNNSLTPSNEVFNIPPDFQPSKEDNQSAAQGDPSISIDGKTLLLGDTGNYVVNLDAQQQHQAYKVWRLGIVDDFDDEYVSIDPTKVEILGADGTDYTKSFNVQSKDGVMYVFAKTVDTKIPATGETVKGDPQPSDLKAYSEQSVDDYQPLKDPAIDQSLMGRSYQVVLPYTVVKVTGGYVVKNKATQVVNDVRKTTNEVSNPLKPINPAKDVTVKVGGESVNGHNIWLDSTFLYQLDSSIIPANRAYPQVDNWSISDPLNPEFDQYTGQWAVYASRDLYKDGTVLAAKGEKIAGSGFDSGRFGGDLFTAVQGEDHVVTVEATDLYKALVSADNAHENGWRAYLQCKRVKVSERVPNTFVEHYNGKDIPSNEVWTRTPNMTPSIHIEKWDRKSGWPKGDRDDSKDAINVKGDTEIVFTIKNTSKVDPETGKGAYFQAKDLKLTDKTIVGDGTVTDLKYPSNWDTLILKPGESIEVTGTLKGVTDKHTDRAKVTGIPLLECPTTDDHPFDGQSVDKPSTPKDGVKVDGVWLCGDTLVESNQDDWNGLVKKGLASTGSSVIWILVAAIALGSGAGVILHVRRREEAKEQTLSGE